MLIRKEGTKMEGDITEIIRENGVMQITTMKGRYGVWKSSSNEFMELSVMMKIWCKGKLGQETG